MGLFKRGNKLWITFKNVDGKWKNASTGFDVGQEEQATAVLEDVLAEVARATGAPTPMTAAPLTLTAYVDVWTEERRKLDQDWKTDKGRLEKYVLPRIGHMLLRDIRPRHIIETFAAIRTTPIEKSKGKVEPPAPKNVHNIYGVLSAVFRDALLADKVTQDPCILDKRHLGPLKDKDPEWRAGAVFSREEVETIIAHPQISLDRQMVYGLELLAGVRPGEAAALRWRHYDAAKAPLGQLLVAKSYNTRRNREKGTKTDAVKYVPVHPTLAAMLAEWKLSGWTAMMGREPGPDDLIVPLPPKNADRRRSREGEAFRGTDYSYKRWLADLAELGWRHRRHYDMRATFITLAVDDGADPDIIESRVTHTKKSRRAFDGYVRGEQWVKTCAEVAKLKIARKVKHGAVIQMPIAVGAESSAPDSALTVTATKRDDKGKSWRRWESNDRAPADASTPQQSSREVTNVVALGSTRQHSEPVMAPYSDAITAALDRARDVYVQDRDEAKLRRALLRLLAEIG